MNWHLENSCTSLYPALPKNFLHRTTKKGSVFLTCCCTTLLCGCLARFLIWFSFWQFHSQVLYPLTFRRYTGSFSTFFKASLQALFLHLFRASFHIFFKSSLSFAAFRLFLTILQGGKIQTVKDMYSNIHRIKHTEVRIIYKGEKYQQSSAKKWTGVRLHERCFQRHSLEEMWMQWYVTGQTSNSIAMNGIQNKFICTNFAGNPSIIYTFAFH